MGHDVCWCLWLSDDSSDFNEGTLSFLNHRRDVDALERAFFQRHSELQRGSAFISSEGINDIHQQQMALLSLGLFCLRLVEIRFSFIPQEIDWSFVIFISSLIKKRRKWIFEVLCVTSRMVQCAVRGAEEEIVWIAVQGFSLLFYCYNYCFYSLYFIPRSQRISVLSSPVIKLLWGKQVCRSVCTLFNQNYLLAFVASQQQRVSINEKQTLTEARRKKVARLHEGSGAQLLSPPGGPGGAFVRVHPCVLVLPPLHLRAH